METNSNVSEHKALVAVFDDLASANKALLALQQLGFEKEALELVSYEIHDQMLDVYTPTGAETTGSSMAESAVFGGLAGAGIGAAAGITASIVTGFPGLGLAMIFFGGLTGAAYGGVGGVDQAIADDSVDLPKLEEYESLIAQGMKLLVVRGTHDQVHSARDSILDIPLIAAHIHKLHGHEFHEHSSG